ncbi:hypothetical protein I4U23_024167 [Adineta vaga]|nr:hypothetical protein I4U23_024167 [Adineta vaga]
MYFNGFASRFNPFLYNSSYKYRSKRKDEDRYKQVPSMRSYSFPNKPLSSRIDLRRWMTPIEHQQDMNTCCANAFAGVCEYLIKLNTGRHFDVSRLFIYYNAQIMEQRTIHVQDSGSEPKDVALGIRKYGVCDERTWPYEHRLLNQEPSSRAYDEASKYTVILLKIPFGIEPILRCLHNRLPIVISIKMVQDAGRDVQDNGGVLSIPARDNTFIGRTVSHAVLIVGYDLKRQVFLVRNSWGDGWGYDGYFRIPFDYLKDSRLTHSTDVYEGLWTIQKIVHRDSKLPTVRQLALNSSGPVQRKYHHY